MIHQVAPALRESRIIHWLLIAIALWLSYGWNVFDITPVFVDTYSEGFVVRKIEAGGGLRPDVPGGFLHLPPELAPELGGAAYRPNPGWQGILLSTAYRVSGGNVTEFVRASKLAFAFLWSLVAAAIVMVIWSHFGAVAAIFALITFFVNATMVAMSVNLYWSLFIVGASAAVAWLLIERQPDGRLSHRTFLVLGLFVFLKSLTGYEWITAVALTCCVPLVYFALMRKWTLRLFLRNATWVMSYCIAGFVVALGVHLAQGVAGFGSVNEALKPILSRAMAHTYGDPAEASRLYHLDPARYPADVPWISLFYRYLIYPIAGTPGLSSQGAATLLTSLCVLVGGLVGSLGVGRRLRGVPAAIGDIGIPILFAAGAILLAFLTLVVLPDRSRVPDPVMLKVLYRATVPLLYAAAAAVLAAASWRIHSRWSSNRTSAESPAIDPRAIPLLATASAAFIASASWLVLAKSHSAVHTVLNIVLFGIMSTPLIAAWLGMTLEGMFRRGTRLESRPVVEAPRS